MSGVLPGKAAINVNWVSKDLAAPSPELEQVLRTWVSPLGLNCAHPRAYVACPPTTTNQTGHRCPDCGREWLTFPSAVPEEGSLAEIEMWVASLPPLDPPLKELKPGENPWLE